MDNRERSTGDGARAKVVVALPLAPALVGQLADYDVAELPAERSVAGAFEAAMADAHGVLVSSNVRVDRDIMALAPKLRVISTMSVGLDHIDLDAASERGITVTFTPVLSDAVADLTIMLMTMLSRRVVEAMAAVATGRWRDVALGGDLAAKTLLVVGFGRIGQAVAQRALAAKMLVRYVDARNDRPDVAGVSRGTGLADELVAADFVSMHVDLNPGTRGLMGRQEFALMKSTAFFVNTSRGGVVDQDALVAALTEGQIAGAGLDVLRDEPPPPGDPLLGAPNVVIVPHIGSATVETRGAMAQCAVDNLLAGLRGQAGPYVVV